MTVELMTVVSDYYPHLSKAEALRKANNQQFPFSVFKIEKVNVLHFWYTLRILLLSWISNIQRHPKILLRFIDEA
jgi:hypothetical protein